MAARSRARRPNPTGGWAAVVVDVVAISLATGLAVSTLWPVYQSPAFVVAVVVSAAVGMGLGILGARFRLSSPVMLALTIGAYLLIGVPLGIPDRAAFGVLPTLPGLLDLLAATALSWKQLLTIATPVGDYQALLVPVVIMVLVSTVVGMTIAQRSRRPQFAAAAPALLFVTAILFGPTIAAGPIVTGLFLAIVLVLWTMLLRLRATGRTSTARRWLGAVVVISIAVALGAGAAVAAPSESARDVLRERIRQPFDPRAYPSPLSAFRSWLQPGTADETMFTVEGLPAGAFVRLAALDTYDGIVYSVGSDDVASASGSFTRLPYRLDQSATPGADVDVEIEIDGYDGIWVPGAGRLESIEFDSDDSQLADAFFYNDNAATAAVLGGLGEGASYRASAVVPRTAADIRTLRPGTAVLPPVGVEPDGVLAALDLWTVPTDPPGDRLAAAIDGLRREGYVSHGIGIERESRSGHSADRIGELMTDKPMLGDAEQYATAAALLAREIGFPARVVIGFSPTLGSMSGPVNIVGRDITAWIEVQDASGEWLGIDPNPEPRPIPEPEPDTPEVVSRPQVVLPPPPEQPVEQPEVADPQPAADDDQPAIDPVLQAILAVLRIAGLSLAVLAIIASPFLAVIVAKIRRRRLRRLAPTPLQSIEGGWREFTDGAVDRGFAVPRYATREETAALIGSTRSATLASTVDHAVFSPGHPGDHEVEQVWREVDTLQRSMDAGLTRWQRLAALVSVRSFRRYSEMRKERS